jgi:hypothetical protein
MQKKFGRLWLRRVQPTWASQTDPSVLDDTQSIIDASARLLEN